MTFDEWYKTGPYALNTDGVVKVAMRDAWTTALAGLAVGSAVGWLKALLRRNR